MKKIYKLVLLCLISTFFTIFDVNAETKAYFKLPGDEIIVPSDFASDNWLGGFTCDYTNGYATSVDDKLKAYSGGISITFLNKNDTIITVYTGTKAEISGDGIEEQVYIADGELYTNTWNSDLYLRDYYMRESAVALKENRLTFVKDNAYHFELNYDMQAENEVPVGKNNILSNSMNGSVPGSMCPPYLYIYSDIETVDGRDETLFNFTLSNNDYNEIVCNGSNTSKNLCTSCYAVDNECVKVCPDEKPNCDYNEQIIKHPKNMYKFINNGQSDSEQSYRQKYCSGDDCKIDVDPDDVDDSDENIEETPIEDELDIEYPDGLYPTLTCNYETQFLAIAQNNAFGEENCVKGNLKLTMFSDEKTGEYKKIVFYNSLGTGIFSSNGSTFTFCKDGLSNCDARDEAIGYLNIEDFIDENNPNKCVDTVYWAYEGTHMYIFASKDKIKDYYGLDFFECEGKDMNSAFCQYYYGQFQQEDKIRLFNGALKTMTYQNSTGFAQAYNYPNNKSICPIDKYIIIDDVPDYDPYDYDIVFNCESLGELADWLSWLFIGIQVGSIILTVALTALDIIKAISSSDEKNYKKVWNHLVIRLIVVALLFLLKPLCMLLLDFFGIGGDIDFCI